MILWFTFHHRIPSEPYSVTALSISKYSNSQTTAISKLHFQAFIRRTYFTRNSIVSSKWWWSAHYQSHVHLNYLFFFKYRFCRKFTQKKRKVWLLKLNSSLCSVHVFTWGNWNTLGLAEVTYTLQQGQSEIIISLIRYFICTGIAAWAGVWYTV